MSDLAAWSLTTNSCSSSRLRLAAEPETNSYRVTIELTAVNITVEVVDADLRRGVRTAAGRCAERLRERGFTVSTDEVLTALEEALENSEVVRTATRLN